MQLSVLEKRRAEAAAVCALIDGVSSPHRFARHERALAKVCQKIRALVKEHESGEEGGRAREAVERLTHAHQYELAWYIAQHHSDELDDLMFEFPPLIAIAVPLERSLLCVG
jgi:hypothetical protein